MHFDEVVRRLAAVPQGELPGPGAQASMAPRPRRFWVPGFLPEEARPAAALVLIYPKDGEASLLLTVRGLHLANHRGQVSLPGGAVEAGETIEHAALREAEEEVGLAPSMVTVRLRLTPLHIPVSGYVLHPVVATATARPAVRPAAPEVDRVVEVPLARLADGSGLAIEHRVRDGVAVEVPYFELPGAKLWGATAMVVAELLTLLEAPIDPWSARQRLP